MSSETVHEFKIPDKTLEEVKELQELFSQQPTALSLDNYDLSFVAKEKWNKTTKKYEKNTESDTYRVLFKDKGTNNAPASIPLGYFRLGRGSLIRASGHYLGGMTPADLEIKFNQNTQKGQNTTSAESAKHVGVLIVFLFDLFDFYSHPCRSCDSRLCPEMRFNGSRTFKRNLLIRSFET